MRYGQNTAVSMPAGPRFSASLAASRADVVEAQRLRYRVFAEEMGARLPQPELRLDRDRFDAYADHLLVRDTLTGAVVGTYRMLPAREARKVGRLYSEAQFELGAVARLPGLVEVGRACVHPGYRTGAVIGLLWAGLATYLQGGGYEHVIGCASIPASEDRVAVSRVCRLLLRDHLGPVEWRVAPRTCFDLDDAGPSSPADIPPLIRGYLRLGARVCGAPAWDPEFRTADLLLLLPMAGLDPRWARRLLRP